MRTLVRPLVFMVFVSAVCFAQSPSTKTASKPVATKPVTRAVWFPFWQTSIGVTEEEFKKSGLDQLTEPEGDSLWSTVYNHRPYLSCGPSYTPQLKDEYNFVHIFVTGNTSDAEFVGRLRLKISAVKDVKMASSSDDADLTINILTVWNVVGGTQIGITVGTTVSEMCTLQTPAGEDASKLTHLLDSFINAGPNEDDITSRIANSVEASDFDAVRQSHAKVLKSLSR